MTMLSEIGAYLDSELASLTLGTTLFLGQLPDDPDTATGLHGGSGPPPDFTMGATDGTPHLPNMEYHRLQVVCRAADAPTSYTDAETQCWAIWRKLSIVNVTLSGVRYHVIEPLGIPAPLEEDAQRRISFVANFMCTRTSS